MMVYEDEAFQEAHLYASREEMESLALHDDGNTNKSSTFNGSANGRDDNEHHYSLPSPVTVAETTTNEDGGPLELLSSPHGNRNSFNSFLEPPSYADAMFRSFDGDHGKQINGLGVVSTSAQSTSSDYLEISVTHPRKEHGVANSRVSGVNTYVTYLITTWTNLPEFNDTFSVRRRFSDVVTLSDRLLDSYRGFFLPMRPDKGVVESQVMQKQKFVEQRRIAVEMYLRNLAAHPVIRRSEELRVFLQVQGKLPLVKTADVASRVLDGAVKLPKQLFRESVIDPSEVVHPARGKDLLRIFKEMRQSVTYGWGGTKTPLMEEDKEFMEKRMKLQDFELQLTNVSQQAESLVKAQQDIGESMGRLGLAFVKLTKFETEEAVFNSQKVRARDMRSVVTSAVKANRSNALLTVQTLESEVSTLNSRIEKLEAVAFKVFGGDRSRIQKIEELKEAMRVTDGAKDCAENNKSELERLDKERRDDFFGMLKGFVINQAGYAEKMASAWETTANATSGYAQICSSKWDV
ncbi:Phox homologous domain-containing protein [Cynara cardunculus var. scolymus]|uniref:Phox homologous domain-containing protein n=1 Tax=Cynara cardunculus var. scolymus TaxID=59895 RepID=A0A103Y959_CYNCS|nr:Phox homologous domain-containing protein [Cynara cardunculus var. scolymus]